MPAGGPRNAVQRPALAVGATVQADVPGLLRHRDGSVHDAGPRVRPSAGGPQRQVGGLCRNLKLN